MQFSNFYLHGGESGSIPGLQNAANLAELGKQLLVASRDGDKAEVAKLLAKGAPVTSDWLGTTPLHLAAQYGHASTVEVLLKSGSQKDSKTKVERTPLHVAAQEGHRDVVELLLKHGAEIDVQDLLKMTPLHWAVERGHDLVVQKLLEFGAEVNMESKFGKTSLEIASDMDRPDIFEVLQNAEHYRTHPSKTDFVTMAATQSIIEPGRQDSSVVDLQSAEDFLKAATIKTEPPSEMTDVVSVAGATTVTKSKPIKLATVVTTTSSVVSGSKPTVTRLLRLGPPANGQTSTNAPKIIKVTPQQLAAIKSGNTAALASLSHLKSATIKRSSSDTSDVKPTKGLKVVHLNTTSSIQLNKPIIVSSTSTKPGTTLKLASVCKTKPTVVQTMATPTLVPELKKQLEECQKTVQHLKELLLKEEEENERLKKLLGEN